MVDSVNGCRSRLDVGKRQRVAGQALASVLLHSTALATGMLGLPVLAPRYGRVYAAASCTQSPTGTIDAATTLNNGPNVQLLSVSGGLLFNVGNDTESAGNDVSGSDLAAGTVRSSGTIRPTTGSPTASTGFGLVAYSAGSHGSAARTKDDTAGDGAKGGAVTVGVYGQVVAQYGPAVFAASYGGGGGRTGKPGHGLDVGSAGITITNGQSTAIQSSCSAAELSMRHSPRLHDGALRVLDSGNGHVLRIDRSTGERERMTFLPGFVRGLAFRAGHAFVGLSMPRDGAFHGLALEDEIGQRGGEPSCGAQALPVSLDGLKAALDART